MLIRMYFLIVLALLTACGGAGSVASIEPGSKRSAAALPQSKPELVAIDLFGTEQITLERLLATHGKELRAFGEAYMRNESSFQQELALLGKIGKLGDFAIVRPSLTGYYRPGGMKYYLTIEFVDRVDAARRMPFRPAPTGRYEDPGGLLADWLAFESKINELLNSEKMSLYRVDCPAFHCLGDSTHADLKQLADRFVADVPAHVEELVTILQNDRDVRHRGAAAFLLAYSKDGPALVKLMALAFRDHATLVRNNAGRVIADIVRHHPELEVPLDPVLQALNYPAASDRNKAAAILAGLLKQPGAARLHRVIAKRAGATLLAMLRLQQPNNHDFAYDILKAISGQQFGERHYAAWEAWLAETL